MKTHTKEEAEKLFKSKFWEKMSKKEIAMFQLHEPLLCMPFDIFHEALESVLNRPVYTHEFAYPETLIQEMEGNVPQATLKDIINKFPKGKPIVVLREEVDNEQK